MPGRQSSLRLDSTNTPTTCDCPTGKTWYGDNSSGGCYATCPDPIGGLRIEGACQCSSLNDKPHLGYQGTQCLDCGANNSGRIHSTQNGGICVCRSGKHWTGSRCISCSRSNFNPIAKKCCSSSGTPKWNGSSCEACPRNNVWRNGQCVCKSGFPNRKRDGSCVNCGSERRLNSSKTACECSNGGSFYKKSGDNRKRCHLD